MDKAESNPVETVEKTSPCDDLCAHYRCDAGFDEMCQNGDEIRPYWEYLIRSLKILGRDELERRSQEARRLMRDNGVTYNILGDPQGLDRPWQLDPIPLLINSEEWGGIERGLAQRAELMNLLLADLYGTRQVLRKGLIPVELIATHPGFLRPCVGIQYRKRDRLPLYAADLIRTSDGQFWVLADRTQAPTGAGYALENRLVMSRILPSLFRDSHVHRLALFFRTLRNTLAAMSARDDHRIVVLSAGPTDESYFEHAYLAKYLGYTLVQGADLTVRDGRVRLKTLDGLQPVDVILRRVDDFMCDPLELRPDSFQGVAGLVQAMRMGNVSLANPLGSSLLENPGLLAYLPQLARHFLGEDLHLPSPQTWWCGDRLSLQHVLANMDKLVIKRIAHLPNKPAVRGRLLSSKQRELLSEQIKAQPTWFVGTEEMTRATAPVFVNGRLEPRQMILRSFLVSNEQGYVAMPGGLTRVMSSDESAMITSQSSGISKDTWVLASEPEREVTLLNPASEARVVFESQGELPSRVAENLFWLGRYAERAEGTIRLLRAVLLSLSEPYDFPAAQNHACLHTLLRAVTYLTETYPGFIGDETQLKNPETELLSVFLDKNRLGSLSSTLQALLNAAYSVRERVSPDMWRVINNIHEELSALQRETSLQLSDVLQELDNLIISLAAFSGMSVESMTHEQGWRFLMLGRALERSHYTTNLLRATLSTVNSDESTLLEHLLNITDSLLTYRRRYRSHLQVNATLELLLQSEFNPRSIGFNLKRLREYIKTLHREEENPYHYAEGRLILEALTQVRLSVVDVLAKPSEDQFRRDLDQLLVRLGRLLPGLSDAITNSYFSHAEQPRQLVGLAAEVSTEEAEEI
ncbi:circularly permuted type 2 ATP-grasp protein [Thioflexithrix psekupsensis]|uniref:Uncharacterized protein n=1 Tax=Thioflexithrix psekupsensis TaxID=1570016 RepID=A0A251XB80_9GAMM|nr:circularly permuted type 2 ATP-grasp protein [Thioflexithrix psekupsensis]OUD15691.1 hypothetical protein TPSD3_04030 [Thioflexithrix psekupsensis]